jgi:hypothetical protein
MKQLACIVMLVFFALEARADDWLTNGDFSSGNDHWYGEAKWPTDFAPPDPFTKADPFTAQGMILPLKGAEWIKEMQDFKAKGDTAALKITYVVSPDLSFANKPDDLKNMPDKIGWDHWAAMDAPPNVWVILVSQIEQGHCYYTWVTPKLNTTAEQTVTLPIDGCTAWDPLTLAFAIPPGTGTIVIHKVSVEGQ